MKLLLLCVILVVCIDDSYSAITSSSGLQKKQLGESCTFQWTVTGTVTSYTIQNHSTGNPMAMNSNSDWTVESKTGIITLTLRNIQLWDAGNYSLSVVDDKTVVAYDATALLFVFGSSISFINQTGGPTPAMEGRPVELTCTVIVTSLPDAYRTKVYYFWQISRFGQLQQTSSGPAVDLNGNEISGYNIKNDGRTLVIVAAQYSDTEDIRCWGQEDGSTITSNLNLFYLQLNYRPHTYSWNPPSKEFNAVIGSRVGLYFFCKANPPIQFLSNWTFVNTAGNSEQLPPSAITNRDPTNPTLTFNFTSENYYGSYSVSLSNSVGSTTETFQVLPVGPPDKPSDLRILYVSHIFISLQFNCGWANGRDQMMFVRLTATENNAIIATQNMSIYYGCYNQTLRLDFTNDVQPGTNYEASAWSTSVLGSSDVVRLAVKTPSQAQLSIAPNDIKVSGNQAVIDYTVVYDGRIKLVLVSCCVELTGVVDNRTVTMKNGTNRFVYDDLPEGGDVFIFDVTVYGGSGSDQFYLTTLKGIKASRTHGNPGTTKNENAQLLIAVIVLAVVSGVAILALIICLIVFLVLKCHKKRQLSSNQQQQAYRPPTVVTTTEQLQMDTASVSPYERMGDMLPKNDDPYENLHQPPPNS